MTCSVGVCQCQGITQPAGPFNRITEAPFEGSPLSTARVEHAGSPASGANLFSDILRATPMSSARATKIQPSTAIVTFIIVATLFVESRQHALLSTLPRFCVVYRIFRIARTPISTAKLELPAETDAPKSPDQMTVCSFRASFGPLFEIARAWKVASRWL